MTWKTETELFVSKWEKQLWGSFSLKIKIKQKRKLDSSLFWGESNTKSFKHCQVIWPESPPLRWHKKHFSSFLKEFQTLECTFNEIKHYFTNTIADIQKSGTWKVRLTMAINFISSKDINKASIIHSATIQNLWLMIMQMMLLINFSSHLFRDIKLV